jgi:hypothetical protein
MTATRLITAGLSLIVLSTLGACGKDEVRTACDEPQPYQSVVPGKRIVSPEGLDELDQYREMPIPEAKSPPRPEGSSCIEYPPAIPPASS